VPAPLPSKTPTQPAEQVPKLKYHVNVTDIIYPQGCTYKENKSKSANRSKDAESGFDEEEGGGYKGA